MVTLIGLAQGLHEPNPASHLIWWIGGVTLLVGAVIAIVELVDWLLERASDRRNPLDRIGDWKLEEPDSALRARFFRRLRPRDRLWPWGDRLPRERRSED